MHVIFVLEIIGTAAFAVSGAIVGIRKEMDLFGVAILGLTTAVGGGILRDLILDITPPAAFQRPVFAVTAILVSSLFFLRSVRMALEHQSRLYEMMMLIMDTIGLGVFTVVGVQAAKTAIPDSNIFLITFVGVLTGVGGGILRDVFAGYTPFIFIKHFYASASIIGAWLCAIIWVTDGELPAMIAGAASTMILRLMAARYRWSLPRAK